MYAVEVIFCDYLTPNFRNHAVAGLVEANGRYREIQAKDQLLRREVNEKYKQSLDRLLLSQETIRLNF